MSSSSRTMPATSAASLVRITRSIPCSICSTVSPMRSASRAALASASTGVLSAPLSRCRGSNCRSGSIGYRYPAGHQATDRIGEADEPERQGKVEQHVELQHLALLDRVEPGDQVGGIRQEHCEHDASGQLEQQVAESHVPAGAYGPQVDEQSKQAAAEVGTQHQAHAPPARKSRRRPRRSPTAGRPRGSTRK